MARGVMGLIYKLVVVLILLNKLTFDTSYQMQSGSNFFVKNFKIKESLEKFKKCMTLKTYNFNSLKLYNFKLSTL